MERLMGDEQRRLFRETQAVMSLLEGFSDYVMDEVGTELVPDVERICARFHERRDAAHAVRARDAADHRHGPQDGAVPEGRGVRPRHRDGPRAPRRCAGCGTDRRRCRATARSSTPSAGSPASSTATPALGDGIAGDRARRAGPGRGPGGAPAAIALTPILSAR